MSDTQTQTDTHHDTSHDAHAHGESHAMPLKLLAGVLAALLVLTWLTYAATWIDLGNLNIWLALFIAVIKGGLVVLYFMHLRYDAPFNGVILLTALLFVAIFIAITLTDATNYQQAIQAADEAAQ